MYKNKAFEKIKYSKSCIENLHHDLKNDKRQSKWKKQRAKYGGWDERATWNLNLFMTEHIYTWLAMYYKYANKFVDLDFHKFTINGKELTQKECIFQILKDIRFFLKHGEDENMELQKKALCKIERAYRYIGIVFPSLWW